MSIPVACISSACSLGFFPDSSAAALAGLVGTSPAEDFTVCEQGDDGPQPLAVAAVPIVGLGFSGVGRLTALFHDALGRLIADPGRRSTVAQSPWFIALPDPLDRLIEGDGDTLEDERARVRHLGHTVTDRAGAAAGLEHDATRRHFYGGGRTAFALALEDALRTLSDGAVSSCIVGALDSLLSDSLLESLADDNLLRSRENAYGIVPGEGIVLMLLDAGGDAPGQALMRIGGVVRRVKEPQVAERGDGRALAEIIGRCAAAGGEATAAFSLLDDQNGERERAVEWGDAVTHLNASGVAQRISAVLTPAESFGETGVATPALALTVAAHAFRRPVFRAPPAAVVYASDSRDCSAILAARA